MNNNAAIISIDYLIATINLFDKDYNVFFSLKKQTNKNFRVIVIHQGDSAFDMSLLDGLDYQYINIERLGLSHARNYGIKISKANYISLLDDDAHLPVNYTDLLLSRLSETRCDGICGIIVDPESGVPLSRSIKRKGSFRMRGNDHDYFMSSAVTMRAEIFKREEFDEMLGVGAFYGASEEMDFFLRVIDYVDLIFDDSIVVEHPSDHTKIALMNYIEVFKRGYQYGLGRGAVFKKSFIRTRGNSYLNKFIYMIIRHLFVIVYDISKLDFKFVIRDCGSLCGRIYGFLKYTNKFHEKT